MTFVKRYEMLKRLAYILLLFIAQGVDADTVVIGPGILNGSFESGVNTPWKDCTAISNASFAAEGEWYAQARRDVWRAGIFQFFPAVSTAMPNFTVTFQLRNGTPPYTEYDCSLSALRQDGSWLSSSQTQLSAPSPDTDGWSTHWYVFTFNEVWDESRDMQLHIGWNGGETNSFGFLDNVRLTQISDPTSIYDMSIAESSVTLTIQHLAVSNTFSIQRCLDLTNDSWISASEIDLTPPEVQWSEVTSNQWDKVFYRLKHE